MIIESSVLEFVCLFGLLPKDEINDAKISTNKEGTKCLLMTL